MSPLIMVLVVQSIWTVGPAVWWNLWRSALVPLWSLAARLHLVIPRGAEPNPFRRSFACRTVQILALVQKKTPDLRIVCRESEVKKPSDCSSMWICSTEPLRFESLLLKFWFSDVASLTEDSPASPEEQKHSFRAACFEWNTLKIYYYVLPFPEFTVSLLLSY